MPRYSYIAKSQPYQTVHGDIEAHSQEEAISKLTKMGYFPLSVQAEGLTLERRGFLRFWQSSPQDIALFTRQLASLIESDVGIINSLNIISDQMSNKYLKLVLSDAREKIKDGKPLSESLASHPDLFTNLYTSIIHSGEAGGNLADSLKRLADFLEKEQEFKNSVRSALTYPVFVLSVGILTIIVLLGFVIPRLVSMFEDLGQVLPLSTRILMRLSDFLRGYWWLILAAIFLYIFLSKRLFRNAKTKLQWDRLKLNIPKWGEIILKTEVSRLMRTLSLLLSGGVTIVTSLDISMSVISNQILKFEIQKFKDNISQGVSFSECLKGSRLFPPFVINIVSVGEQTGSLEKAFIRIADEYERDVDRSLKTFARMLEPVIILVMGLIVGFIVMSMLLPIFQINLIAR